MTSSQYKKFKSILANHNEYQFYLLQVIFWSFVCIVTLITLTLWYAEIGWPHVSHTILQALCGSLLTFPLHWLFIRIWKRTITFRIVVSVALVLFISLIWTFARMFIFVYLTDGHDIWNELGGWYFTSIFIFLCWASFFHGTRYFQLLQSEHQIILKAQEEVRTEQVKRIEAQSIARDAKLKMLRYQLNPHFLCNTLNAVNSLIESGQTEKAQRMTVQLSKFLRYSLDHNPDTTLPLQKELNALNLYLEIEKTRFENRLTLDFKIDALSESANIPSLLLQPIIENSMKHVISKNEEGGTITLRASVTNNILLLELSDTGSGVRVEQRKMKSSKVRGIGLRNIDERLKALYNDQYKIDLSFLPSGGLKTSIQIPYESSSS